MIDFGILFLVGIFGLICYAVYCSSQCDCVNLNDWDDNWWNSDFQALSDKDREMLTRVLS